MGSNLKEFFPIGCRVYIKTTRWSTKNPQLYEVVSYGLKQGEYTDIDGTKHNKMWLNLQTKEEINNGSKLVLQLHPGKVKLSDYYIRESKIKHILKDEHK